MPGSHRFSRALHQLHVFGVMFNWFTGLSAVCPCFVFTLVWDLGHLIETAQILY